MTHRAGASMGTQFRRPAAMHSSARRALTIAFASQIPIAIITTPAPSRKRLAARRSRASCSGVEGFSRSCSVVMSESSLSPFALPYSRFQPERLILGGVGALAARVVLSGTALTVEGQRHGTSDRS